MSDALISGLVAGAVALAVGLLGYRRQGQTMTSTPYGDMVTHVGQMTARVDKLTARVDVLEVRDDQHRARIDVLTRRDTLWRQWADATRAVCAPFHSPADLPTLPTIPKED